jgi:hypothetical protein
VDPRADLDDVEKREFFTLPVLEHGPLGSPVPSQFLYRLRYPGSSNEDSDYDDETALTVESGIVAYIN